MRNIEKNTLGEAWHWFVGQLSGIYDYQEATAIGREVFLRLFNIRPDQKVIRAGEEFDKNSQDKLETTLNQLKTGMPVQYVTGVTNFLDTEFELMPGVLIPRQETQELVLWVASTIGEKDDSSIQILDIGTGSGCIAITLAKLFEQAKIFACDISVEALKVAKRNAQKHKLDIHFFLCDILETSRSLPHPGANFFDTETVKKSVGINHLNRKLSQSEAVEGPSILFDCIVSNPPYVRQSEKVFMRSNVVDFEPEIALFVDDNDPLKYYQAIGFIARQFLKPDGMLFFEINEAFGNEVSSLMEQMGFLDVVLKQDIHGKDRFVSGVNGRP